MTEVESWVAERFSGVLTTQIYGQAQTIDGVKLLDLKLLSDDGGDFCEIVRFDPDGCLRDLPGYRPAQLSYSLIEPGAIKAWHVHQRQDDVWFIPSSARLLVGLLDIRRDSITVETAMRLTVGVGAASLIYIPRGVAHGIANVDTRAGTIVYLTNTVFDPLEPDEHRLPHDAIGADFWSRRPG